MGHVQTQRVIPASREELFAFLADLQNIPEQLGGRIDVEFPSTPPHVHPQAEFDVMMTRFHVAVRIRSRIEQLMPNERFSYRQISGFFRSWFHVMILDEHDERQTRLTDIVEFTMPGGLFGHLADDLFVRGDIARLLAFRAMKISEHFERLRAEAPGAQTP
jgi:ligand-binding SRPBCC domain-containing protein